MSFKIQVTHISCGEINLFESVIFNHDERDEAEATIAENFFPQKDRVSILRSETLEGTALFHPDFLKKCMVQIIDI